MSVAERAHVIARSKGGPRGDSLLSAEDRDEYDNLLLLCANCHAMVDKYPSDFPISRLMKWKDDRREAVASLFDVPIYESRRALADAIAEPLEMNRNLHAEYGPGADKGPADFDAASMWRRVVLETVIPNNRKVAQVLRKNEGLLTSKERSILTTFEIHREGLEFNYLSGDKNSAVPVFPETMDSLLAAERERK